MRVLVGDIGGTTTRLALASVAREVEISDARRYPSGEAASLAAIIRRYLDETRITCDVAALAVAGPVQGNRCKTTNLPWELDAAALARELELPKVRLLNDLEAVAWAVPRLGADALRSLHEPDEARPGNACVIAAGTGLGVAGMCWDGARHHPFATEAGHAEFAPTDELEFALATRLRRRHGRVSWERVASGMGIVNLFEFLLDWRGAARPAWSGDDDDAAAIAEAAEATGDERCAVAVEAMDLFARLYARFIGDLGLAHMAVGGIYLAGGVTLSNQRPLTRPEFLAGVFAKGRMGELLRGAPIRVITAPDVALLGAANYAVAE